MTDPEGRGRSLVDGRRDWVGGRRPPQLAVAAVLVVAETLVELPVAALRDGIGPGLRVLVVACVASKLLLAALALRTSAGAVLGLLLCEATAILAAVVATTAPGIARVALTANALAVIALLASSAHAFPTPTPPRVS